jgi:hypothetical protein
MALIFLVNLVNLAKSALTGGPHGARGPADQLALETAIHPPDLMEISTSARDT